MTGTKNEIERKAFDRFDKILVEIIIHKYSSTTINEIENAVNNIDYYIILMFLILTENLIELKMF